MSVPGHVTSSLEWTLWEHAGLAGRNEASHFHPRNIIRLDSSKYVTYMKFDMYNYKTTSSYKD